jgi:tripartite-type tricarboxylate transporter receptor subunit TctC
MSILKIFVAVSAIVLATVAGAQVATWPSKPVKVQVGFQPGGGTDLTARVWAKHMSEIWGQPVVVENRPGAGGNLGIKHMFTEPADGYTLSMTQTGNLGPQHILSNPGYEWQKDMVGVAYLGDATPFVVVVNSNSKVTNLKEFEAWARTKTLNYAVPGIGVPHHIFGASLSNHFGIEMTAVPYKGTPQIINDLSGGVLDFIVSPTSSLIEQNVATNKFNVIAVINNRPWPAYPNTRTMGQQGIDGFVVRQMYVIMASAGTPDAVVRKIRADSKTAWARAFVELRDKGVIDPAHDDWPDSFEKLHQDQQNAWTRIIQKSKIKSITP